MDGSPWSPKCNVTIRPERSRQKQSTVDMSALRTKPPKVTFYPVPTTDREKWRLLAHVPGSFIKYIGNFDSKTEAEAWASGPGGEAWVRTNCPEQGKKSSYSQ